MTEKVKSTNNLVKEPKQPDYGPSKTLPQYIAALSVCMGSVATGTVLGWTGNVNKLKLMRGDLNDIYVTEEEYGWIGSFVAVGALLMCFPIGIICDLIGRKITMLLTIIPFSIGWLLIIFAQNVPMIYAGRFLTGLAGGSFCVSAPMYTSEIAQKEVRGTLGSYFQLLMTAGILFAYVMGHFASPQIASVICGVVPLAFGVIFFLQPETPFYLLKKGKEAEALASMQRLRGPDYHAELEIADIKNQMESESSNKTSLVESLKSRVAKKAVFICFGLMFFQQLSGINAVVFYVGTIFKEAGSSLDSEIATILVGIMQMAATFVSSLVIDRFGRKILLIGSGVMMTVSGVLLAVYFTLKDREVISEEQVTDIGMLPIIALSIFVIVFSLGYGPIPWMISSEVSPAEIKSALTSAAGTFNWFLAFLVTKFYGDLTVAISTDSTFYIFAAISCVGSFFVFFVVPETKGKSLEQIQRELDGGKSGGAGVDNEAYTS